MIIAIESESYITTFRISCFADPPEVGEHSSNWYDAGFTLLSYKFYSDRLHSPHQADERVDMGCIAWFDEPVPVGYVSGWNNWR